MKNLDQMTKEQLIEMVKTLKKQKKYGLVWEDKPEDVVEQCKKELPVLDEVKNRAIEKDADGPTNLLIEGDNYHALSVLNYTHSGKVDLIYIDPPFNTGSGDFIYNDKRIDIEDAFRHSKWLSFMEVRLRLAKRLLSKTGSIFVQIDSNENAQLRLLMDEIFGPDAFRNQITWQRSSSGKTISRNLADDLDYILWYSATDNYAFNRIFKPLADKTKAMYNKNDNDGRGLYRLYPLQKTGGPGPETTYNYKDNKGKIWKCPKKGWRMKFKKLKALENDGRLFFKGKTLSEKAYWNERENEGQMANNLWNDIPNIQGASREKTEFIGGQKPVALIERMLRLTSHKNAIILDFFAGSGTTGHATLKMNKEDHGSRKFILCTNNEDNNGSGLKIATDICYPRIKKVINGNAETKSIPANLRYFKTAFVASSKVTDDTRRELVRRSTDMICVKENTFEKVADNKNFKIYQDQKHTTGILFDLDDIDAFKAKLKAQKMPASIYVFSLSNDTFDEDFENLGLTHELCPIPQSILEVYRKLFK